MEFTICERIPYTLPLQHSADSELWGVCVHDDAHVSYLKKNHEQPQHQQVQSNAGFLDTYSPGSCMSISLFSRFHGEYSLCFQ